MDMHHFPPYITCAQYTLKPIVNPPGSPHLVFTEEELEAEFKAYSDHQRNAAKLPVAVEARTIVNENT